MKKIIYLFLLSLLWLPIAIAKGNVEITNVTEEEIIGTTEVIGNPTFNDLTVSFNARFKNQGDSIKYKITITNKDDKEYKINDNIEFFQPSEYIKYEFEFDNDNKVVEKNSNKVFYVKLTYQNEIPYERPIIEKKEESKVTSEEKYTEQNQLIFYLEANDENPNTESNFKISAFVGILIVSVSALIILLKRKKKKIIAVLLLGLLLIPLTLNALERLKTTVNTTIEIVPQREITFYIKDLTMDPSYTYTAHAYNGDTWYEWLDSEYNNFPNPFREEEFEYLYYSFTNENNNIPVDPDKKIEDKHTYYYYRIFDYPVYEKSIDELR